MQTKFYFFRYSYCRERSEVTDALEWNPQIGISNPILAFKLLRNFGHMIRNLGIDFTVFNAKICAEIENYLVEYCCDSLQRLSLVCGSLDNLMKIPFDDLKKPLKNVTTVKIQTIHNTKLNHIRFINQNNLPNVKHILIYHDATYLDDSEQKIHYETVEYFTVIYAGFQITKYPFSFGRLKHIIFKYLHIQLIDAFSEFINSIGHLQTLKIMNMDFQMDQFQKVLELENIQSNIVELQFAYIKHVSTDDIVRFLNQSHKLRKLTIHQNIWFKCFENYIPSLVETMSSKLNVEWKVCNINLRKHPFEGCSEYTACVIERIIDWYWVYYDSNNVFQ